MSLDALEQALVAAKWGDAEENAIDVIARVLELPNGVVERVLFAAHAVKSKMRGFTQLHEGMHEGPTLSYDLRRAISDAVNAGMKRAAVRHVIQNDYKLHVRPSKLVGERPRDVCDGCAISIECALTTASTPEKCVRHGVLREIRQIGERAHPQRTMCMVTPILMAGDQVTVTCDHPRGTWTLSIEDFEL